MKKNKILVSALSITLLSQGIIPILQTNKSDKAYALTSVVYASEDENSKQEANDKLNDLGKIIKDTEDAIGSPTGNQFDWLKSLNNTYEFLNKIIKNGFLGASEIRDKIVPRIDLLINVAETITADATELVDSEQQAHIIIGFSVSRALLKAADIFESAEGLNKASESLKASLEKARQVPKLTDQSKRTHYTLQQLDKAIANAKSLRYKELRFKLDAEKLAEVDMLIKQAVAVRRNAQATVGEVKAITNELNTGINQAYMSIDEGDRLANYQSKLKLEKDIKVAKNLRDFKLKGNVDPQVIRELNRAIADANRVLINSKTTQNQMLSADEEILLAIDKAKSSLEEKDKDMEVNIPEIEESEEETSEEEISEETSKEELFEENLEEEVPEEEAPEETPEKELLEENNIEEEIEEIVDEN